VFRECGIGTNPFDAAHGADPDCVTVNVCPAIVSVPTREPAATAPTTYSTFPFPVSLAPEVIVNHDTLLVAVQLHLDGPLTMMSLPGPPFKPIESLVGLIVNAHDVSAAD